MLAILLTGLTVTANAASPWAKDADGKWTYTKADGKLAEDEWIKDGGKWYYFIGTEMAQDEVFQDIKTEKWYAADADGVMISNLWFEEEWEGEKGDDTKVTGSNWYYAGADGALVRGWKQMGKVWYYFEEDTEFRPCMYSDCVDEIKGKFYAFKHSGEMIVGWGQPWVSSPWTITPDTNWVYANADGSLVEGWKKIDGKWYLFSREIGYYSPVMLRNDVVPIKDGKIDIDSESPTVYGFDKSGAMVENGWFRWEYTRKDGSILYGSWFYFGKDGAAKKGWFQDKGKWYYLSPYTGWMWTGWATMSDGKDYYLDPTTGAMVTGWKQIDDIWYFFKDSGAMAVKEWVKSGSAWYYLKEDGEMAKDEILTIDGKPYRFDANGVWVP